MIFVVCSEWYEIVYVTVIQFCSNLLLKTSDPLLITLETIVKTLAVSHNIRYLILNETTQCGLHYQSNGYNIMQLNCV